MSEDGPRVYRVAELNRRVRLRLEQWGEVWVEGEIADASRAASGHVYFTLADSREPAQIRVVMFRGDARFARAKLEDGEHVRLLGRLSLFEPRGTFQLLARVARLAGEGDRRAELERLKKKLAAEGFFAPERKRSLPRFPRVVGVVTSRDGAALYDIERVAAARAPVRLVLSHCQVQGPDAPESIALALWRISRLPGLEVLILARGGGASEDLSAFNDERVARAIAACPVPVVSGVGHETDDTIADLVADVRAATPSNAAELVVPDREALASELAHARRRLERALEVRVGRARLALERAERALGDPRRHVVATRDVLRASERALERAMGRAIAAHRAEAELLARRLGLLDPRRALATDRARLVELEARLRETSRAIAASREIDDLHERLRLALPPRLARERGALGALAAKLDALSPLGILARGYAIALSDASGKAIVHAKDVAIGDTLTVRVHEGVLRATVTGVEDG